MKPITVNDILHDLKAAYMRDGEPTLQTAQYLFNLFNQHTTELKEELKEMEVWEDKAILLEAELEAVKKERDELSEILKPFKNSAVILDNELNQNYSLQIKIITAQRDKVMKLLERWYNNESRRVLEIETGILFSEILNLPDKK